MMHAQGKSDSSVVPTKPPNNDRRNRRRRRWREDSWPRGTRSSATHPGLSARSACPASSSGYVKQHSRIRKLRFTALLHHVVSPRHACARLSRPEAQAAPGVDGETWQHYGERLEDNLHDLAAPPPSEGAYRAQPSSTQRTSRRRTGGNGRSACPTLEDKIVQRAVVEVLNAIYEQDFLGFSYGFRPRRSPHQALDALTVGHRDEKRELGARRGHSGLLRYAEPRMARPLPRAPCRGPARHAPHPAMAEGRRAGGRQFDDRVRLAQSRAAASVRSWPTSTCTTSLISGSNDGGGGRRAARSSSSVSPTTSSWASSIAGTPNGSSPNCATGSRGSDWRCIPTRRDSSSSAASRSRTGERVAMGNPRPSTSSGFTHAVVETRKGRFTVLHQTMRQRWQAKLHEVKTELRRRLHALDSCPGRLFALGCSSATRATTACPRNGPSPRRVPRRPRTALARHAAAPQPDGIRPWTRMRRLVARWLPLAAHLSSYPNQRLRVCHPRQEPDAVVPHVRICGGGAGYRRPYSC